MNETVSHIPARRAVVLLSGGIDSATAAAVAKSQGFRLHALTVDYGQRHRHEIEAAQRIGRALGVEEHVLVRCDLRSIGGSALLGSCDVPKDRSDAAMARDIPATYVPARNTVFLALALAKAEQLATGDIFIGVNAVDYSGYPDCRPEFIAAFEQMARRATKLGIEGQVDFRVHTPLINLTKAEIIRRGAALGLDYRLTHSCYDPDETGRACGRCDSCQIRRRGFAEAGVVDPTEYQTDPGNSPSPPTDS